MNYNIACKNLEIIDNDYITIDLIKKQYRFLSLKYHPDKNYSYNSSSKFQEINESYRFLLNKIENNNEKYYEYNDSDNENYEDDDLKNDYRWVLSSFLNNILYNQKENEFFYTIIHNISTTCEKNALYILENIDKKILIKIHDVIIKYRDAFHFTNDFFDKIEIILNKKIEDDECIILNPTIYDLLEANLYKLKINGSNYIIPLWHNELIYDNSGNDLYVKCSPIIDEDVLIDSNNNIIKKLLFNINDIWGKEKIEINICNKIFVIFTNELKFSRFQTIILHNKGIPYINTNDVYDISKRNDIILQIELTNI